MADLNATFILVQNMEKFLAGEVSITAFAAIFLTYFIFTAVQKYIIPKHAETSSNTIFSSKENILPKQKWLRLTAFISTMTYDLAMLFALIIFLNITNYFLNLRINNINNLHSIIILLIFLITLIGARLLYKRKSIKNLDFKTKSFILAMVLLALLPLEAFHISYSISKCHEASLIKLFLLLEMILFSAIEYMLAINFKRIYCRSANNTIKILDNIAFFLSAISYVFIIEDLKMESVIYDAICVVTILLGMIEIIISEIFLAKNNLVKATVYYKNNKFLNNIIKITKENDFLCLCDKDNLKTFVKIKDVLYIQCSVVSEQQPSNNTQIFVHCKKNITESFDNISFHNTRIGYYSFRKYNPGLVEYTIIFDKRINRIDSR